jgi:hypothetical protein
MRQSEDLHWISDDDYYNQDESLFTAHIDEDTQLFLTIIQHRSQKETTYYASLSILEYGQSPELITQQKRIESADKVALVFIKNIDELVKKYFQSKASDVGQMKPQQSMKKDILGFDQ